MNEHVQFGHDAEGFITSLSPLRDDANITSLYSITFHPAFLD